MRRRNLLNKPYDCEIEYIANSGTSYIDTGVRITGPYEMTITFSMPTGQSANNDKGYGRIIGVGSDNDKSNYQYCNVQSSGFSTSTFSIANRNLGEDQSNSVLAPLSEKNTLTITNPSSSSFSARLNGTSLGSATTTITYSKAQVGSVFIFCFNHCLTSGGTETTSTPKRFTYFRLYSCSFKIGGTLVRDFIPVSKNGVGYLYDKISGELFGNQGSGEFVLGKCIYNNIYDCELTYIANSGTSYIDTGVRITGPYEMTMAFSMPTGQDSDYGRIIGVGNSSNGNYQYCNVEIANSNINKVHIANRDTDASSNSFTGVSLSEKNILTITNPSSSSFSARLNGTLLGTKSSTVTYSKAQVGSVFIFCINKCLTSGGTETASTPNKFTYFRLYSCSFKIGGTLVRDFITVSKDGVGYLYDNVSGELFGNEGSGEFVLGKCVDDDVYDYEVEYLQSDGNQYIDTNIIPDSETGMKVTFMALQLSDKYICGLRNTGGGNTRWCIGIISYIYYGYGSYNSIKSNASANTKYTATLNYLNDKKATVNVSDSINLPTLSFTPEENIRLFGAAGVEASYGKWDGRIYSVQITQGSEIIRDFIPVRKNGVGYMYDRIGKRLYGNNGTGSFTLGPDM